MPKIRNTFIKVSGKASLEVIIYYIPKQGYTEGFFFVTTTDTRFIIQCDLLSSERIGKNYFKGTKGPSEDTAIENFKEYLIEYKKRTLTKEPLVFIKINEISKNQAGYDKRDYDKDVIDDVDIHFSYKVGYKMKVGDEYYYYEDGEYHNEIKDNVVHNIENYTVIPFSKEVVEKCEQIVQDFITINNKIHMLFNDPDKALSVLLSGTNLLTNG